MYEQEEKRKRDVAWERRGKGRGDLNPVGVVGECRSWDLRGNRGIMEWNASSFKQGCIKA